MVILHILNSRIYSGAEHVVCSIIKNLPKDCKCVYLSPKGNIQERLEKEGIEYYGVDKLSVKTVKRAMEEIKPDIIHAHDFRASVIAAEAAKREIKVISHLHCNPPWLKKVCINSLIYKHYAPYFQSVLTVSDSVEKEYRYAEKIADKVQVVGNPFSVKEVQEKIHDKSEEDYDLLFVGRMTEEKNPLQFVEIFKSLKYEKQLNIKGAMIGAGDLYEACEKKIQQYGLQENLKMLGFQENPYKYMATSKVLCMPSKWEGFGLVALEAMCLGCPVVASSVGGLQDIVTEESGKKCQSHAEYVEETAKLLTDEVYYSAKSQGARKRADSYDNLEEYIGKIVKIY